jgi:hypothetical protein
MSETKRIPATPHARAIANGPESLLLGRLFGSIDGTEDEDVLSRDLEPAIDAFADHVIRVLNGAAGRSIRSP